MFGIFRCPGCLLHRVQGAFIRRSAVCFFVVENGIINLRVLALWVNKDAIKAN